MIYKDILNLPALQTKSFEKFHHDVFQPNPPLSLALLTRNNKTLYSEMAKRTIKNCICVLNILNNKKFTHLYNVSNFLSNSKVQKSDHLFNQFGLKIWLKCDLNVQKIKPKVPTPWTSSPTFNKQKNGLKFISKTLRRNWSGSFKHYASVPLIFLLSNSGHSMVKQFFKLLWLENRTKIRPIWTKLLDPIQVV